MNNELNSATQAQAAMPPMWVNDVGVAYRCVRKHNQTIPDETLDLMREILLAAAPPSPQPVAESGNRALMDQWNEGAAMILALEALDVATTPLPEDRQTVLRAQSALRAALARHPTPAAALQPVAGLTDADVWRIRDTIKPGDGWDGDNWDLALAYAIERHITGQAGSSGESN